MKPKINLSLLFLGVGTALLAGCDRQIIATKPEVVPALLGSAIATSFSSDVVVPIPAKSLVTVSPKDISSKDIRLREQPIAKEVNPPGDIPDSQTFIVYTSKTGHYQLDVPEGWARTETGADVSFIDKLNGVTVTLTNTTNPSTADSVRTHEAAQLEQSGRAVQIVDVSNVQFPNGSAVLIQYTSNSEPDSTTGKQVRLENNAYLFTYNGKLATLRLWAPQGADNVDQWQRMSRSFGWS